MIVVRYHYRRIIVAIIITIVIIIIVVRRRRCCCRVGITEHPIGRGHKFRVGCTTGVALVPFGSFSLATTQSWHITSTATTTTTNNNNNNNNENSTTKCIDSLYLSRDHQFQKKSHTHDAVTTRGNAGDWTDLYCVQCVKWMVCVCVCACETALVW